MLAKGRASGKPETYGVTSQIPKGKSTLRSHCIQKPFGVGDDQPEHSVQEKKMKLNIEKDRREIKKILERNRVFMYKNKNICEDIADCILLYFIEKEK